jgi:hypothetical protein
MARERAWRVGAAPDWVVLDFDTTAIDSQLWGVPGGVLTSGNASARDAEDYVSALDVAGAASEWRGCPDPRGCPGIAGTSCQNAR